MMRGMERPVFQDPTELETRSPRCPELARNGHRGRAEVYDRVEEGGRRDVQNTRRRKGPPNKLDKYDASSGVLGMNTRHT